MVFIGILVGLIILVLLVVVHELGHAIVARRNGVVVEEFGIGFPPSAKKWRPKKSFLGKNVVFSLNWLPLGGFVKLKGEYDSAEGAGTYGGATFWVKTKILLAGVMMNWLTAVVLFMILALVGMPKILPQQAVLPFDSRVERSALTVARVTPGSPAEKVGLQRGDEVRKIGDRSVTTPAELSAATKAQAGREVTIELVRSGQMFTKQVKLQTAEQAKNGGYLGVGPQQTETIHSTWSAPIAAVVTTGQLTYETVAGVGSILVKTINGTIGQLVGSPESRQAAKADLAAVGESVAGPVGILGVLFPSVLSSGVTQILLLAAIISLTLAVMNVLPIPALDGGRWFTMAGFKLFKKKLTKEREETIQSIGFLVLMALTVLVTWSDIAKVLRG